MSTTARHYGAIPKSPIHSFYAAVLVDGAIVMEGGWEHCEKAALALNTFDDARAALEACRDYIGGWDGVAPHEPPTDKRSREAREALDLTNAVLEKMTPPQEPGGPA